MDSTKEDNQKILIANSKSKNQNRTNISKGNFFKQFIKLSFIILIVFGLYLLFFGKSTAEEVDESVKIENWVSKKEWVTFVKEDNVNNSFIRTFLNNSATSLKYKASKGAEDAATVIIILIILFGAIPILIPAMTVILFINDLYYSNPFGFIGSYYDWLILNIKLIFAIFGLYL